MTKAIIARFECPSCGNILVKEDIIAVQKSVGKYVFNGPSQCSCGRKSQFTLLSFVPATALIKADE